ncbi:MAG: hypothetical protein HYV42_01880 [Candidatus Magasanikbacteria bacterium]|nr:hypothetical protein [Candidatus Magasanikbacteria bacterium]
MFAIVDGIDGSGKSTVLQAWADYLLAADNAVFDLRAYWKIHHRHPGAAELRPYNFIISGEPTHAGVGRVIRDELIRQGTGYPERAIAEAYSLDRLILYTTVILPALQDGKTVLQDRGVSTSLCYQALSGQLTEKFLTALPGNTLALQHPPDHLVLLNSEPAVALSRLGKRTTKRDNVIFENLAFQTAAAARFASSQFRALFTDCGTVIHDLAADVKIDILQQEATRLLSRLLASHPRPRVIPA